MHLRPTCITTFFRVCFDVTTKFALGGVVLEPACLHVIGDAASKSGQSHVSGKLVTSVISWTMTRLGLDVFEMGRKGCLLFREVSLLDEKSVQKIAFMCSRHLLPGGISQERHLRGCRQCSRLTDSPCPLFPVPLVSHLHREQLQPAL